MTLVLVPPLARTPRRPTGHAVRTLAGDTMGTTWSVKVAGEAASAEVERAIRRELDLVTAQMSPWEPASDLTRFNTAPAGVWMSLPPAFAEVLRCALAVAEQTGGAFDPTLGELTGLWGFGPQPFRGAPPATSEIEDGLGRAGWRNVRLEGDRLLQPGGLSLDLNGIAKGYAVDRVGRALDALGLTAWLVEIGGELRGRGVKPDGLPWWVQLEAPPGDPEPAPLIALMGLSVATSGSYQRFFDHDGRRYAHTLDPATGRPLDDRVMSVSVLHEDCMWADAMATALMVMDAARVEAFVADHAIRARIVTAAPEGPRSILSPALAAMAD